MAKTKPTREQMRYRQRNYPLKMFCWHLSHLTPVFHEAYERVVELEFQGKIRGGAEVTGDPHAIYAIDVFLEGSCDEYETD
jgi:hypothetical protein